MCEQNLEYLFTLREPNSQVVLDCGHIPQELQMKLQEKGYNLSTPKFERVENDDNKKWRVIDNDTKLEIIIIEEEGGLNVFRFYPIYKEDDLRMRLFFNRWHFPPDVVDDLCQTAWTRLWNNEKWIELKKKERDTYFFNTLKNLVIDRFRRTNLEVQLDGDGVYDIEDNDQPPDVSVKKEKLKQKFEKIIETLPSQDRTILMLKLEDKKEEDIARELHIKQSKVSRRLKKIGNKLMLGITGKTAEDTARELYIKQGIIHKARNETPIRSLRIILGSILKHLWNELGNLFAHGDGESYE